MAKWQGIVKANREAPTLRFADGREELPRSSTAAMAAAFRPTSTMEQEIAGGLMACMIACALNSCGPAMESLGLCQHTKKVVSLA